MPTISLFRASMLYLFLPVIIFWWGWFHWGIALAATCGGLWLYFRLNNRRITHRCFTGYTWLILSLISFGWVFGSGIGEFRPQHFDYFKHNLLLNNLVRFEWPIVYKDGSYLCYYVAYYVPAALLAKVFGGIASAKLLMFGWSWVGLMLVLAILYDIGGWKFLWIFLFFNSVEAILLVYEAFKSPHTIGYTLADLWTNDHTIELLKTPGGLMIPSHVESFTAAPQHSLPAWLIGGILLKQIAKNEPIDMVAITFLLGLGLYWSPLVVVGFSLFWLYAFIKNGVGGKTLHLLLCFCITLPAFMYYAGHIPIDDIKGWWWQFVQNTHEALLLLIFLLIEIGFWLIIWWLSRRHNLLSSTQIVWVGLSIFTLLAVAVYRFGYFNDLTRRACLPALLIICWNFYLYITTISQKWLQFALLFFIGILPLKHYLRWFTAQPYTAIVDKKIVDFTPNTIHYLRHYHEGEFDVVGQYMGKKDALYKSVMKPKKQE